MERDGGLSYSGTQEVSLGHTDLALQASKQIFLFPIPESSGFMAY